jgi:hypothetical protein
MFRILRASTMTQAKSTVVRVVSQIQRTAYCMAAGWRAQIQPDQRATRGLKQRAPISQTAAAVSAEAKQLSVRRAMAEAAL